MNTTLQVAEILKKYPFKKILIGLSGGPDSIALLHLLLVLKEEFSLEIGLAHIDHGWREESNTEARLLQEMAEKMYLPFFLHKIDFSTLKGNLENESRNQRLAFFQKICKEKAYEALLLAHHADDQAETVLKRCLEGANVFALQGMTECKSWNEMNILRPLISIPKKHLLDYLNKNNIAYFIDPTNNDSKFLRSRMRKEIFPLLNEHFGKNIQGPLCRLGSATSEMKEYIQLKVAQANILPFTSDLGIFADLSKLEHPLEIKFFLINFFKNENILFNQNQLNIASQCILQKKANRKVEVQGKSIFFDRGYVFYFNEIFALQNQKSASDFKEFCYRPWKLKFEKFKRGDIELLGWKSVFAGHCRAILPFGEYMMQLPKQDFMPSLDRLWNERKVPAFLRTQIPVLCNGNGSFIQEFLSGQKFLKDVPKGDEVTVSLYRE